MLLYFACVVDDAKCIVVTRVCDSVCLSVCLSARGRMPTLLHGPGCNFGGMVGVPVVVHYCADLQSVHELHCYGSVAQTRNVSKCLYSLYASLFIIIILCLTRQLFKGTMYYCDGSNVTDIVTRLDCYNKGPGYRWVNQKYNFDNLGQVT